jgi:two-component system OmpR family response regulator
MLQVSRNNPRSVSLQVDQSGTAGRLLIVDDETLIRASLTKSLSLVGYSVEEAPSGEEALALLGRKSFDLMLLDMVLPGIKGIETLRQARQLQPDLSIIILTGNATLETAIAALKSEVTDYLLKPAGIHEIIDAVTRALQKKAAQAQKAYLADVLGQVMEKNDEVTEPSPISLRLTEKARSRFVHAAPLRLDRSRREVTFADEATRATALSKGETAVLASLLENAGQVLSCQQLMLASWGYDADQTEAENVIRPYIFRLRKKLEENSRKPTLIRTVRRRGYRYCPRDEGQLK